MKLLRRCGYCGGRGWYTTGGWHRAWGDVYDDLLDVDCECCHGSGCGGPLWPLAWLWRRLRWTWRWVRRQLEPADPIPF